MMINAQARTDGKSDHIAANQNMLNKITMQLTDPNLEQMYTQNSIREASIRQKIKTLKLSIVGTVILLTAHIYMIFQQNEKTKEPWTNDQKFEITAFAV
jgi:hypothetical protein